MMNERKQIKKAVEESRIILANGGIKTDHLIELSHSSWEIESNLEPGETMVHLPSLGMYAAFRLPKARVS